MGRDVLRSGNSENDLHTSSDAGHHPSPRATKIKIKMEIKMRVERRVCKGPANEMTATRPFVRPLAGWEGVWMRLVVALQGKIAHMMSSTKLRSPSTIIFRMGKFPCFPWCPCGRSTIGVLAHGKTHIGISFN